MAACLHHVHAIPDRLWKIENMFESPGIYHSVELALEVIGNGLVHIVDNGCSFKT